MKRIYANQSFSRRMNASAIVVILAILFGIWELWQAINGGGDSYGFLFAAFFIFGGLYGVKQFLTEYRDMVVALDIDEGGRRAAISIWRPFASKWVEGGLDDFRNWRYEKRAARGVAVMEMLLAEHPAYPDRTLKFELYRKAPLSPELRGLAPEAVGAYERAFG